MGRFSTYTANISQENSARENAFKYVRMRRLTSVEGNYFFSNYLPTEITFAAAKGKKGQNKKLL